LLYEISCGDPTIEDVSSQRDRTIDENPQKTYRQTNLAICLKYGLFFEVSLLLGFLRLVNNPG
jgi:hypothetical protein